MAITINKKAFIFAREGATAKYTNSGEWPNEKEANIPLLFNEKDCKADFPPFCVGW